MITVSARVAGADDLARRFEAAAAPRQAIMVALEVSATIVQAEAIRLILDGPKSGRVYKKYGPRRYHQASAPGEAPANDLGWLAANIVIDRANVSGGRINIASLAKYSRALEFGTRRIRPRPFLRRALASRKTQVQRAFVEAIRKFGVR